MRKLLFILSLWIFTLPNLFAQDVDAEIVYVYDKIMYKDSAFLADSMNMSSFRIKQLMAGLDSTDAVNVQQLEDSIAANYGYDSIRFSVSDGYLRGYNQGVVVDSTGFDGRYILPSDSTVVFATPTQLSDSLDAHSPNATVADSVNIAKLNDATYDNLQQFINITQSSGKISGGVISNNGDSTVAVTSGTGFIRASNSATATNYSFDWDADNSIELVDQTVNYIYVDYDGGTPIIKATTTKSVGNNRDKILLGKVFRDSAECHCVTAGMLIAETPKNTLGYLTEVFGEVVRASGIEVGETGTRNITTTNGILRAGLTKITTTGINTETGDYFTYYYYDNPDWIELKNETQIDNLYYNDTTSGLEILGNNKYGIHWVYGDNDGHVLIVYGWDSYSLTEAEIAVQPPVLPAIIGDFAFPAAKIIIGKNESSFYAIESAYAKLFPHSAVPNHGDLSGLSDDDHPQYMLRSDSLTDFVTPTQLSDSLDNYIAWTDTVDIIVTHTMLDTLTVSVYDSLSDYSVKHYAVLDSLDIHNGLIYANLGDITNLIADSSNRVPYEGANRDVDLGAFSLTAATLTDGTWSTTAGEQTGLVSLTDGTASWIGNDLGGFVDITATDTISGGWLRASNNGIPSIPAIGWASNGMYLIGSNTIGFATNNILSATIEADQDWLFAQDVRITGVNKLYFKNDLTDSPYIVGISTDNNNTALEFHTFNATVDVTALSFSATTSAATLANTLTISSIANGAGDFLTEDAGLVKFRTAAEVLSDIGAATKALDNLSSVAINTSLLLGASDGGALGSGSKMWSDLFLASGGVINWDNGDVILTHSANTLTFASGNINLTFVTTAKNAAIEVESTDPAIRFRRTGGTANERIYEIRNTNYFQVRKWNDAEDVTVELFGAYPNGDFKITGGFTSLTSSPSLTLTDSDDGTDQVVTGNGGILRYDADLNKEVGGSEHQWWVDEVERMVLDASGLLDTDAGYLIGGSNINTAGILSNVAYLDQIQSFSNINKFTKSTTAKNAAIEVESTDPAIRFRKTGGTADKRIYELRNVGVTNEGFQLRVWNDAENATTVLWKTLSDGTFNVVGDLDVDGTSNTIAGDLEIGDDLTVVGSNLNINGVDYQWPGADGNAGDLISTDGKNVLSFVAPTADQVFKGTWNANTNTPELADGVGDAGWYYVCVVAGTTDFGAGGIAFVIGDKAICNGAIWQNEPTGTGTVKSVAVATANGFAGTVATSTTTPVITLTTSITGLLEGNGTAISAASVGIADDDIVEIDGTVNDGEFGRFTANGLEGRTALEVLDEIDASTKALDNLSSVAINTTLVSDIDNTDALGTTAIAWSDLFLGNESVITWNTAPSTPDITLTHSANLLTLGGGNLALGGNDITMTGSLGLTGSRLIKGWFADLEVTNMPTVNGTSLSSIFSLLAGSVSITTLGTINIGTWQSTQIADAYIASAAAWNAAIHNPVTIGTANGLSLSTQQLSLALSSTSTTGALNDTDWDIFNNKLGATSIQDDVLNWNTSTLKYEPYSGRIAGTFYNGATTPTSTNRLNYDGYLYGTRLYGTQVYDGGSRVATQSWTTSGLNTKQDALTFGIANTNVMKAENTPADNEYAKFTSTGLEGRSYSQARDDLDLGERSLSVEVVDIAAAPLGTDKAYIAIPYGLDGWHVHRVSIRLFSASTSGNVEVQIANSQSSGAPSWGDVLSAKAICTPGQYYASSTSTNAGTRVVNGGDYLRVDIDATGTNVLGLHVTIDFKL